MAYTYDTVKSLFTAICDAIRAKDGTVEEIDHQDIPDKISELPDAECWDAYEEEMHKSDNHVRLIVNGPAFGWYTKLQSVTSQITVDWGDGTPEVTYTGADLGGNTTGVIEHEFATDGKHMIKVTDDRATDSAPETRLALFGQHYITTNASEYVYYVNDYASTIEYISNGMPERGTSLFYIKGSSVKKLVTFDNKGTVQINYAPFLRTIEAYGAINSDFARNDGNLETVKIVGPKSRFGPYAFSESGLRTFDISETEQLQTIEESCFANCTMLESIYLPDTVTELWRLTFVNCVNLSKVRLPEGNATNIPQSFFIRCMSLEYIALPASFTSITAFAFKLSGIKELLILNTDGVVSLGQTTVFDDTPMSRGTGVIYVPDNLVANYQTATNWSTFSALIKGWSEAPEDSMAHNELVERGLIS